MKKILGENKRGLFLAIMFMAGSVFTLIYLVLNGNADQIYHDIIVEYTSMFSNNKSAEKNLLYILIFSGLWAYFLFFFKSLRNSKKQEIYEAKNLYSNKSGEFMCVLVTILVTGLLVFGETYEVNVVLLLYVLLLLLIDKALVLTGICTLFLAIFANIGLYRTYVFWGGQKATNSLIIAIVAFFVSLLPLCFRDRKKALLRYAMIENLLIPGAMLLYFSDKYLYGNEIITISVPGAIKILIGLLIAAFLIEALYIVIKKWNVVERIDEVITCGSCITILAYKQFCGTGAIMPTDMHHPFENVIGYSQIFELGQTPFEEYIPVSGMYSVIQGWVFDVFGAGTFANYYITNNLFFLFIIILIVVLLKVQLDGAYVLLITLILEVQSYNRLAFMLPIMLLLCWPKLIEKKNLWLITWFLTSLFQGLYYPLYGAATCVAFFPLLGYQIVTYIKSGELKKDIKKISFWTGWGICIVLLVICTGCLLGTLKHMLAMSGQSILANGISRFGQLLPERFFPYINSLTLRIGLYYIFTWMVPVGFVWIAFALMLHSAGAISEKRRIKFKNIKIMCIMVSAVIMPIVCYTYTIIRLDVNSIYARSSGVLATGMVLVMVFTFNYVKDKKLRKVLLVIMVAIPVIANTKARPELGSEAKLEAHYMVPEGYLYRENDIVKKIGTGFIEQNIYNTIQDLNIRFTEEQKTYSYMGDPSQFGYFYLIDIKGDGAMEIAETVKSFSAAKETIEVARVNKSIISPSFITYYNYYLYHWLVTSGEYVWDSKSYHFIPNEGKLTQEETIQINKNIDVLWNDLNLYKTAASWGASMESLEPIFTEQEIEFNTSTNEEGVALNFEQAFDGDTADFMYLEFENMDANYESTLYNLLGEVPQIKGRIAKYLMKRNYNPNVTVLISWLDDNGELHDMSCAMSKGKLLIPLGAGTKWLLHQHQKIFISVYQNGNVIDVPKIANVRFLKLREVN